MTITFGSLTFVTPCRVGLSAYQYRGDVSSETLTNPIQQCVSQGAVTSICSAPASNYLAPPMISFSSSPLSPINLQNVLEYTVSGSCAPVGSSISIDIDGITGILSGTCSGNHDFALSGNMSAVSEGMGLPVTATIQSGSFPAVQISSTVDRVIMPVVSVVENLIISATNVGSYSLSGACSEEGEEVTITLGSFSPTPQPTCSTGTWSLGPIDVSALPEGAVSVTVDHSDALGNSAVQASFTAFKDVIVPIVSVLNAPNINLVNVSSYAADGTCSEDGENVDISIGGVALPITPICSGGVWSFSGVDATSAPEGASLFTAEQVDAGSNIGQGSMNITKDTGLPLITLTADNISGVNELSYSLSGTCSEDGEDVLVNVGGITPGIQPICSSGLWSITNLNVSALAAGLVLITVDHTDDAGNQAVQVSTSVNRYIAINLTIGGSSCVDPYTKADDYTYAGAGNHTYNATTDTLIVTPTTNYTGYVGQEALPADFEMTYTMSTDFNTFTGIDDVSTSSIWNTVEFANYFPNNGSSTGYENGTNIGNFGVTFPADVRLEKIGTTLNAYLNGTLRFTRTVTAGTKFMTFAGVTGTAMSFENLRVNDLSQVEGFHITGSFTDPNGANGPYELYDVTNDVVISTVTSPFDVVYSSGLITSADIVVRSVGNTEIVSASQAVVLSDCLEPLTMAISSASCVGPITKVDDYTYAGAGNHAYNPATDTFTVTPTTNYTGYVGQEALPNDFEITYTMPTDFVTFTGIDDVSTSSIWNTVEFANYQPNNGLWYGFQNGTNVGNFGITFPAEVRLEKIGTTLNSYLNGTLRFTRTVTAGTKFMTFAGVTGGAMTFQNLSVEDISVGAPVDYVLQGIFTDPNGLTGLYELYDETNDVVIGTVSSPFQINYNSGLNSNADIVVRRVGATHIKSPVVNLLLDDCI